MRTPQRNNQKFLVQLRKSHAAFTARSGDFATYPVDLAVYGERIAAFDSAVADATRYETETVAAVQQAQDEYRATVAAAREKLRIARSAAEAEEQRVRAAAVSTRDAAETLFVTYQNIAEAVYLGRRQPQVLDEFDTPTERRKSAKPALPTQAAM